MPTPNAVNLPDFVQEVRDLNGTELTVKIVADKASFSAATGRTRAYKALPYAFRPILEKVGDHFRTTLIPRTFKKEGPGWAPLSRRTVADRLASGYSGAHPILQRSGDLFKSLTDRSHPKHIEIYKTGRIARVEIGSSSVKFLENQMGKKEARLPARPMIPGTGNLPLDDRDRIAIKSIVQREILQRVKR